MKLKTEIEKGRASYLYIPQIRMNILKGKFDKFADYFGPLPVALKAPPKRLFYLSDSVYPPLFLTSSAHEQ